MITVLYLTSVVSGNSGAVQSLFDLIESVRYNVKPIVLCGGKGYVYDYFVNHGIECYISPYTKVYGQRRNWFHYIFHPWHLRFVKNYRYVRAAARLLKKELSGRTIDIIHSNELTIDFGYYLSRYLKVRHVWHIREYMEMGTHLKGDLLVSTYRLKRLANKADARIFISNPCRNHWNLNDNNTWTLLDAVRSVNDCCVINKKQNYFLFCSYDIKEAKGASLAIKAFGKSGLSSKGIWLKMLGGITPEYK